MEKLNRIAIHSVPRSGSTWLGSIFDSHPNVVYKLQPLFSYAFKDRLNPTSAKNEIDEFLLELASSKDDFLDQNDGKARGIIPSFNKKEFKHLVYKEVRYHHVVENLLNKDPEIKVIGLIRNPLSVINSWWKAPKEFRNDKDWKIQEEWKHASKKNLNRPEEFNGFEKWKEVAILFEELEIKYPSRFYLLKYDDLLLETLPTVKDLFEFSGLTMSNQTEEFLQKSRSTTVEDAYGVFKKKENDHKWKKELPVEIIGAIQNDLRGTTLEKYLK